MANLRSVILLALLLSVGMSGAATAQSIIKIEVPAEYRHYSAGEIIKKVLAKPRLTSSRHIFSADTTVVVLASCGSAGIYRFGQGATDHAAGNLIVVVRKGDELLFAQDVKSYSQHRTLVKTFWKSGARSSCDSGMSLGSLQTKVAQLVNQNSRVAATDVF